MPTQSHAAGHHGESFPLRSPSSSLFTPVVSLLSLYPPHASPVENVRSPPFSSPYIRASRATDRCTNATPRHSRQPPITAEQLYRRGLNDRWRSLSYPRSPLFSLSEEKERFTGSPSCSHPRKTTSLAQQREYVYIYIYAFSSTRVRSVRPCVRGERVIARARVLVTECSPRLEVARPDAPLLIIVVPPVPPAGPAGGRGCARDRPNQKGGG